MKIGTTLFIAITALMAASVSSGEIYQWIDENGIRHFTGHPPPPSVETVKSIPEIPYDRDADLQRMRREHAELEAVIAAMAEEERYLALEHKLRETEKRLKAVEKKVKEAADKAEQSIEAAEKKERQRFWYPIYPYPHRHSTHRPFVYHKQPSAYHWKSGF